jgi:clan AA aspartic protease
MPAKADTLKFTKKVEEPKNMIIGDVMGEIRLNVKLENDGDLYLYKTGRLPDKEVRRLEVNALVDTGAVMVLLPQDMVENLGLIIIDKTIVTLANEEKIELEIAGTISLTAHNRNMKTDCLVGPPLCEPLVGQIVLERLDLAIDPIRKTAAPRPESPYLPCVKLK